MSTSHITQKALEQTNFLQLLSSFTGHTEPATGTHYACTLHLGSTKKTVPAMLLRPLNKNSRQTYQLLFLPSNKPFNLAV